MAGPRRKRRHAEVEAGPQDPPDVALPQAELDGVQVPTGAAQAADAADTRRQGMAEIARRRAAHFANYQDEDAAADDPDNVHVGSNSARTLGPWSSAVELVNARQRLAAAREDKILSARRESLEDTEVEWEPSRSLSLGPRKENAVRPLLENCVDVICEYIDCVDTFYGLPDAIKVRIAAAVCIKRKLSPEVAGLFVNHSPGEVVLPDCTQLDSAAMSRLLRDSATTKLERLVLGSCGRGLGDEAAAELSVSGPLPRLVEVELQGAYRLSDKGLAALLAVTPCLTSLAVPAASRITAASIRQLPALVPRLEQLSLHDCRGVAAEDLTATLLLLPNLRRLDVHGIPEVNDTVLAALGTLPALHDLCVSSCQAISDAGVTALAAQRSSLTSFSADECVKLTDASLLALAGGCKGLKALSVRRCPKLTDTGLAAVAERGCLQRLNVSGVPGMGPVTMRALAMYCKELEELDVSFCRKVPERALGKLADSCHRLRRLVLFGCSQVSRTFLHGHSNDALDIQGVGTLTATPGPTPLAHKS